MGGDGNLRAQIVFKGRRGIGNLIQGRRWVFEGAEGWRWVFDHFVFTLADC